MRMPPQQMLLTCLVVLATLALMVVYVERHRGGEGTVLPGPSFPESSSPESSRPAPSVPAPSGATPGGQAADAQAPAAPSPGAQRADTDRNGAGDFDYYALVLSWSPTHCETAEAANDVDQCARPDGRRFGFILHGLWPQYERGYPESCPTLKRPYVRKSVIDGVLDIMPAKGLVIHEYRKHGTCSGLSPEAFFQTARRLFTGIKIPDRFRDPADVQFASPREVEQAFVAVNPGLTSDMMAVGCGGPGSRLREVRVCFSKSGTLRACGPNEDQDQLCRGDRMTVLPVR